MITDKITTAEVWVRRWVDCGPNEPADTEEFSFEIPVRKGIDNAVERMQRLVSILYPDGFFAGFNIPYQDMTTEPDPF